KIFLVDRAVQAHNHAQQQLQDNIISDAPRQYSDIKLSSSLPSPLMNNNLSVSPMISPHSQPHVITSTTNTGNIARKKAIIMLLLVAILYFIAFSPTQINFI